MSWTAPSFTEIKMDAEIGSYQDDTGRDPEGPAFVSERVETTSEE